MGKMELQRFRLLCIFLFVTILVIQGPLKTYADEPELELEPCPSIIPRPTIAPIPIPPVVPSPTTSAQTPPSTPIPPAPTPSEDDD